MAKKQTANRRKNGQFAPGNREGRRFAPGESGNVKGRPRRTKISEALLAKLAETYPAGSETTIADFIAQVLIQKALKGDVQAIREAADRSEGRPRASIDVDVKTMWSITELMSGDLTEAIRESGLSQDQADRLLEAVEQRWRTIRVDGSRGDPEG
jgi:Family of unknown function (DUF5681)